MNDLCLLVAIGGLIIVMLEIPVHTKVVDFACYQNKFEEFKKHVQV